MIKKLLGIVPRGLLTTKTAIVPPSMSLQKLLGMMLLGFASGLPYMLVFSTLSAWLRDVGISLTEIGFFAWLVLT